MIAVLAGLGALWVLAGLSILAGADLIVIGLALLITITTSAVALAGWLCTQLFNALVLLYDDWQRSARRMRKLAQKFGDGTAALEDVSGDPDHGVGPLTALGIGRGAP